MKNNDLEKQKNKKEKTKFDIKKFFQDNKKSIIVAISALLIVVLFIVIFVFCFREKTNEKKLETKLADLGAAFYEDYYYDSLKKTFSADDKWRQELEKRKDIGIHISLDNLSRITIKYSDDNIRKLKDEMKDFVNSKTKEACDMKESIVSIYPKEKYGKKDYRIEVQLSCGFEKEEK